LAQEKEVKPVTMAVRPVPSVPCVTSSAVEEAENPDGPFHPKSHILLILVMKSHQTVILKTALQSYNF
jgi:hypothetical protein